MGYAQITLSTRLSDTCDMLIDNVFTNNFEKNHNFLLTRIFSDHQMTCCCILPNHNATLLFNIYTNHQSLHDRTRNFIYADDLCVTAQYPSFTEVEHTIEEALYELTTYYRSNSLRANPDKTHVTSFHLKN